MTIKQAIVLVGGRGTRLGKITDTMPKPMVPIAGRPFLDYQLSHLRQSGITEVVMCVGYLSHMVEARYSMSSPFGLRVLFSHESTPAGTGGALALCRSVLDENFFVLNGDSILDFEIEILATALEENPSAIGALALRHVPDAGRYGQVMLEDGKIKSFAEKSGRGPGLVNAGVYCLKRSALDLLPTPPCSLEVNLFPQLAAEERLLGRPCDGYFIDIGLPEMLARAETELPAWMEARNARFED